MPILPKDTINIGEPITENPLVPAPTPQNVSTPNGDGSSYGNLSLEDIVKLETSKVPDTGPGLSINSPTPSISQYERNQNSRYEKYIPGIDNEEYSALNQSWLTQLGHSTLKAGATAAGTFVSSFLNVPNAIGAVKSGNIEDLYSSPLEQSIDTWLEGLEEKFPNFYTHWEQDHPLLSAIPFVHGGVGTANFWGENIIKNMGFTVGAIGGALAQDYLIGLATGGSGIIPNLSRQIATGLGRIGRLSGKVGELALDLNKVFSTTRKSGELLAESESYLKTASKVAKLKDIAERSAKVSKVLDKASYYTTLAGAARTEAAMEARQGYTKLKEDLIQEYKDSHNGEAPGDSDMAAIEIQAKSSANTRFGVNMALLMLSDAIQFDAILNTFNAERRGLSDVLKFSTSGRHEVALADKSLDIFQEVVPKGIKIPILGTGKQVAAGIVSEGFLEEGLQNVTQEGTYNYYHNKYYDENKNTLNDVLKSTVHGFSQTFGSTEGWESVLAGAIMGGVTGPITRLVSKKRDRKVTDAALRILNENTLTGNFDDVYKGASSSLHAAKGMKDAAENGSLFNYRNFKHSAFFNFIVGAHKIGRFDVRMKQIEMLRDLDDETFQNTFHITANDENRKTANEFVDQLVKQANEIKNSYDGITSQFQNPYRFYDTAKSDETEKLESNEKHKTYNEYLTSLVYYASIQKDAENRLQSIASQWNDRVGKGNQGYAGLTAEMLSEPFTLNGLYKLAEENAGTETGSKILNFLDKISQRVQEGEQVDINSDEELRTPFFSLLTDLLNEKTKSNSFGPDNIHTLAHQGSDINQIVNRANSARSAYEFLSTPQGRKKFFDEDEKSRKADKEPNSTAVEEEIETAYGDTKRKIKLKEGESYYILSASKTKEGAVSRKNFHKIKINKITDTDIHFSVYGSNLSYRRSKADLVHNEVYNGNDFNTDRGKLFLNALNQKFRVRLKHKIEKGTEGAAFTQVQGKEPVYFKTDPEYVRGGLVYQPWNDKLYFQYSYNGKNYRLPVISSDQFKASTNLQVAGNDILASNLEADGALESIFEQEDRERKRKKSQAIQDAKDMTEAMDSLIVEHNEQLADIDSQLKKTQKSLERATKKLKEIKPLSGTKAVSPKGSVRDYNKKIKQYEKKISDLTDHIVTLNNQKNQLQYTIDYLNQAKEDIGASDSEQTVEEVLEIINGRIKDAESRISDNTKRINRLKGTIKRIKNLIKDARKGIESILSAFKQVMPQYRPDEVEAILSNTPYVSVATYGNTASLTSLAIPDDLAEDITEAIDSVEGNEKILSINEKALQTANDHLKEAEQELSDTIKEFDALSKQRKALNQVISDREEARKREEEFRNNQAAQRALFNVFDKNSNKGDQGSPVQKEITVPREPAKKEDQYLFTSPTNNQNATGKEELSESQIRYNTFLNDVEHFPDRDDYRIVLVTANNAPFYGLEEVVASQWETVSGDASYDNIKVDDPDKGLILAVIGKVDKTGKFTPVDEKGEPTTDKHVYGVMPTTGLTSRKGTPRYRENPNEDNKARIKPFQESWKNFRAAFMSQTKGGPAYNFAISRGFSTTKGSGDYDVVSSGLIKQTQDDNSELTENTVIKISKEGAILHQGKSIKIPPGRIMFSYRGLLQPLNNRNFTPEEKERIKQALAYLARTSREKYIQWASTPEEQRGPFPTGEILHKELFNWIKGVIHFGTPVEGKETTRNQMWLDHSGYLHLGKNDVMIPFTEEGLSSTVDVNPKHEKQSNLGVPLLDVFLGSDNEFDQTVGIYNSVSAYKLEKEPNKPFNEFIGFNEETGEPEFREWINYQNYILSPTYRTLDRNDPENGKPRTGKPFLSTVLPPTSTYNYAGKYPILNEFSQQVNTTAKNPKAAKVIPSPRKEVPSTELVFDDETFNRHVFQTSKGPIELVFTLPKEGFSVGVSPDEGDIKQLALNNNFIEDISQDIPDNKINTIVTFIVQNLQKEGLVKVENGNIVPVKKAATSPPVQEKSTGTHTLADLLNRASADPSESEHYKTAVSNIGTEKIISEEGYQQFKKWLSDNLPQLDSEMVDSIITKTGGGYAWGSLENSLIRLFKGAPEGTEYHEAFEAVWNYMLPGGRQQAILKEVRKRKGEFFDALTATNIEYSKATDAQLKENIADEFGTYMYRRSEHKGGTLLTRLFRAIVKFFNSLNPFKSELNKLFNSINTGEFKTFDVGNKTFYKTFTGINQKELRAIKDTIISNVLNSIFVEKGSLFSNDTFNSKELFNKANERLLDVIGSHMRGINENASFSDAQKQVLLDYLTDLANNIDGQWDKLVTETKESLKVFGVDIAENGDLEANDSNRTYKDYMKDYFTMDPVKSSSIAIRLLLATLSERVFDQGILKSKKSIIGGPVLVDFAKTFVKLMDQMSQFSSVEEMIENLPKLGDPNLLPLFNRLGGQAQSGTFDYSSLSMDQWRLLINFYETFSRQQPVAILQFTSPDGSVYTSPAAENDLVKNITKSWIQKIRANVGTQNSVLTNNKGQYYVKESALPSDPTKLPVDPRGWLNRVGIHIGDDTYNNMTTEQRFDLRKYTVNLYQGLKQKAANAQPITSPTAKTLTIEGAMNNLARVYIQTMDIEPTSVFSDESGKFRQKYVPHNRLSKFAQKFNKIATISQVQEYLPKVASDVFSGNSLIVGNNKNVRNLFFHESGARVKGSSVQPGYFLGTVDNESGFNRNTTRLTQRVRYQSEINQNLNGWYYAINSIDSNTEHMLHFGEFFGVSQSKNGKVGNIVTNTYLGYLVDEMNLIDEAEVRMASNKQLRDATKKDSDRSARKLRFMADILSKGTQKKVYEFLNANTRETSTEDFVQTIKKDVQKDLNKFFSQQSKEVFDDLVSMGLVESVEDNYTWTLLDKSADLPALANLNDVMNVIAHSEINRITANIEMHKTIFGDPFQLSEKDSIRRKKTYNSPRLDVLNSTLFDTSANTISNTVDGLTLSPGELGRVDYKGYLNTTVIGDIITGSQVSGYLKDKKVKKDLKSRLEKIFKEYDNTDVSDGSAIGGYQFFKHISQKQGQWTSEQEDLYQKDFAVARYEMATVMKDGEGNNLYTYQDEALKEHDRAIYDQFIKNGERHDSDAVIMPIKPIVSGSKNDSDYIDAVIHKYSVVPISWSTARKFPDLTRLFIKLNTSREGIPYTDYAIFESGAKAGASEVEDLYENGKFKEGAFTSNTEIDLDTVGIISQVNYHDSSNVTLGTQSRNLSPMDLYENGQALNDTIKEKVEEYQRIFSEMTQAGFQSVLDKWGVTTIDGEYNLTDKKTISELLQNEMFRRMLPDNVKDAVRVVVDDNGNHQFEVPPEATNAYSQIIQILMSQVDKSVVSPKINGQAAVQVSSAFFSDGITVDDNGNLISDNLAFYEPTFDENGEIESVGRCEIMISSKALRKKLPPSYRKLSDAELLDILNNPDNGDILKGVAFRIPTSGLNLMEAFTVKQFLPEEFGDVVVVPSEITKKTNSDFDIDKLNIYLKNFIINANGDISTVKYFPSRSEFYDHYYPIVESLVLKKRQFVLSETERSEFKAKLSSAWSHSLQGDSTQEMEKFIDENEDVIINLFGDMAPDEVIAMSARLNTRRNKLIEEGKQLNSASYREFLKDIYLQDLYKQSIENKMMDSMAGLILDKNNYERLITPNEVETLTALRDKLLKAQKLDNVKPSLTSRRYLSEYRHNNLVGKINVGQYSLSQIYNTILQQAGGYLDVDNVGKTDYSSQIKELLAAGPKLVTNTTIKQGRKVISFAGRTFANQKDLFISDVINQCTGGAVDMTKDQFLSQLGFVEQRGPVSMAMLRAGIKPDTVVAFINQPIIRDYIDELNKAGATNLLRQYRIDNHIEKWGNNDRGSFSTSKLWDNIKNSKSVNPGEQVSIFKEFIHWAAVADQIFSLQMGINYDRANFSDPSLIYDKYLSMRRAIDNNIIRGAENALNSSFLGDIKDSMESMRDVLATFMVFEDKAVRGITNSLLSNFFQPGQFLSADAKKKLASKVRLGLIDFLIQTRNNPADGSQSLNQSIEQMLINPETATANKVENILNNLNFDLSDLGEAVRSFGTSSTIDGAPINLSLVKRGLDATTSNSITEKFRELKENIKTGGVYDDMIKLSMLQSGLENSPISFTSVIPFEDYKSFVKPYIDEVENLSLDDINPYIESFFRNVWRDNDLTPTIKERRVGFNTAPYMNVPKYLSSWIKSRNSELIGLNNIFNSRERLYPVVKIKQVKPEFRGKSSLISTMVKNRDYSFIQTKLFRQVIDPSTGKPFVVPGKYKGQDIKTTIYKSVNAWGDGYRAKEYYITGTPSVINNGGEVIENEVSDIDIINRYREVKQMPLLETDNLETPTTPPVFNNDNTEGTDESCSA